MILDFSYNMRISFSAPIFRHHYSIKCVPKNTERQRVKELSLSVLPRGTVVSDRDFFGNAVKYGCIAEPHTFFEVSVCGAAETGLAPFEQRGGDTDIFSVQSEFTRPGLHITRFYNKIVRDAPENTRERVVYFMNRLYDTLSYVPHSTSIGTTAEDAFTARRGVCQDYAQILVSLLHLANIPTR